MSLIERSNAGRTWSDLPIPSEPPPPNASSAETSEGGEPNPGAAEAYDPNYANYVLAQQALAAGMGLLNQLLPPKANPPAPPASVPPEPQGAPPPTTGTGTTSGTTATTGVDATNPSALEAYRRDKIATTALAYHGGLSADKPSERDEYVKALAGPNDSEATRAAIPKQSSCGLFARAVWRQSGVSHKRLENNYRSGKAMTDVQEIAESNHAWVKGNDLKTATPHKGDVILIGKYWEEQQWSEKDQCNVTVKRSDEHVFVLTSEPQVDPNNPKKLHVQVMEGGGGKGGHSIHGSDDVTLEFKNGQWKRAGMEDRPVVGWADAGKMPVA